MPKNDATPGARCADLVFPDKNITFYKDGELYQSVSGKEVYYIFGGLRHLFNNVNAFYRMKLEFTSVKIISDYMLLSIPLGHDMEKFQVAYNLSVDNN